jgi:hypothetical protein
MGIIRGRVVKGRIDVGDVELPEGASITAFVQEDEGLAMTPEQWTELAAAIEEADRGETVPVEEVLRELREMDEHAYGRRG